MRVYMTPDFINDLRESEDATFVRRVLSHTVDKDGAFLEDADDHRYHGIEDAWIRYVSKGAPGYRVIYIRKGENVYLYCAGKHDIEGKVKPLRDVTSALPVESVQVAQRAQWPRQWQGFDIGKLYKTSEPAYLSKLIKSMYHIGHEEIFIISPFISIELLNSKYHFGQFLDKAIEEKTVVVLITRPPGDDELGLYRRLEERDILVYFCDNLHTKLYIFNLNRSTLDKDQEKMTSIAILGSANFTKVGIGFDDIRAQEELCYKVPAEKFQEVHDYASRIIRKSTNFQKYVMKRRRN
jgi:hypothetical protein